MISLPFWKPTHLVISLSTTALFFIISVNKFFDFSALVRERDTLDNNEMPPWNNINTQIAKIKISALIGPHKPSILIEQTHKTK